jgi:hypothetical protein
MLVLCPSIIYSLFFFWLLVFLGASLGWACSFAIELICQSDVWLKCQMGEYAYTSCIMCWSSDVGPASFN